MQLENEEPQRDAEENSQESIVEPADDPAAMRLQIEALSKQLADQQKHISKLNKEAETKRHALASEQQQREAERAAYLAEQGEFKKLYEETVAKLEQLQPYKDKYQTWLDETNEKNQQRIENLPEHIRAIVPANYTPDQLQRWLDAAEPVLTTPKPPDIDIGARSTAVGSAIKISREDREMAEKLGLDPAEYAKQRQVIYQERTDK